MALTLESAGKVRQKCKTYSLPPYAFAAIKAFFSYWASNKGNADLQFIPFTDYTTSATLAPHSIVQATGYSPIGGVTSTVHVFYAYNTGSAGTDSFISLINSTTNTNVDLAFITGMISTDLDNFLFVYPDGMVFGTDLTISAATTNGGQTESGVNAAGDGFVIVSA